MRTLIYVTMKTYIFTYQHPSLSQTISLPASNQKKDPPLTLLQFATTPFRPLTTGPSVESSTFHLSVALTRLAAFCLILLRRSSKA